jgi:PAS domain S-box-containing protein
MTGLAVVLVEDDAILCDLLKLRLTKLGYRVISMFSSGEDALRSIPGNLPDLVLMDITLSGAMDGIEAAQHIQKKYHIPVVFLTAKCDAETFERIKVTDDSEYVIKPFTDRDLYIAIEMAYHKYVHHRNIRKKQEFLEKLVRHMGDAVIATDGDGFVTLMNPAAETLTGYQYKSTRKVHFRELVNIIDENGRGIENPVDRIRIEMEVMEIPDDAFLVSAAGGRKPVTGSASPIRDRSGHFAGIILAIAPVPRPKILRYTGRIKF